MMRMDMRATSHLLGALSSSVLVPAKAMLLLAKAVARAVAMPLALVCGAQTRLGRGTKVDSNPDAIVMLVKDAQALRPKSCAPGRATTIAARAGTRTENCSTVTRSPATPCFASAAAHMGTLQTTAAYLTGPRV